MSLQPYDSIKEKIMQMFVATLPILVNTFSIYFPVLHWLMLTVVIDCCWSSVLFAAFDHLLSDSTNDPGHAICVKPKKNKALVNCQFSCGAMNCA